MIWQNGNGERIRQVEDLICGVAVTAEIVQDNGEPRSILLKGGASSFRRAYVHAHRVRARASLQIKKENAFTALRGLFSESVPCSHARQSSLDFRGFRFRRGIGLGLWQRNIETVHGPGVFIRCLQADVDLRPRWSCGMSCPG